MDWMTILFWPLIRALAGWLTHATEDGKITWPEWRKLLTTVLRIGVPAVGLAIAVDMDEAQAAAIVTVVDILIHTVRSNYVKAQTAVIEG